MPSIKFWNPASNAEQLTQLQTQLKIAQHELAFGEDTGNDLVTQLSWEKDARKEAQKKYTCLQREHSKLQHLHILAKARAEALEQENEELLAKLRHLQEQLCTVEVDRDCNWVDYREALVLNNQLTQEVEVLKEQLAAMQEAHPMMAAQRTMQSPVGSPFGSPIGSANTVTFSSAQVKQASFAGFSRSPLSNISNAQAFARLQAKRTTPAASSPLGQRNTPPHRRPGFSLLGGVSPKPTSSGHGPAFRIPLRSVAVDTPVVLPVADLHLPPTTRNTCRHPTGLFSPPVGGTHRLWATSASMDSATYRDMFRPASSCSSDGGENAPMPTPRSSQECKAGSSHSSNGGKDNKVSPHFCRHNSSCHSGSSEHAATLALPKSMGMPNAGSYHSSSSSGEGTSPLWPTTTNILPAVAVLPTPAPAKAIEFRYLRWCYRCGDDGCSCLASLGYDESSSESTQGLQSAQLCTPAAPPKPISRQDLLEERWGYGHSSCNGSDHDHDASAVSGCTTLSRADWSPAATASFSTPALPKPSESGSLHWDSPVSCGKLDSALLRPLVFTDKDSPVATVKAQCLVPGPVVTFSHRSPNAALATGTSAAEGGFTPSSVHATSPSSRAAASATTPTARHSCRATALPSTAEARGSAMQGGLTPSSIDTTSPSSRAAVLATARHSCRPTTANTPPAAAALPTPAPAKAIEFRYSRWCYRCGDNSCSCLSSLDSDESSSEFSERHQSAQLCTPAAPPKPISRQDLLEEHWGYGHTSCNGSDHDHDVSAVSGCTTLSRADWSPAATASFSTPALPKTSESGSLHWDTPVSCGELDSALLRPLVFTDKDSPIADVKAQCPEPGATAAPSPSQMSPASAKACHSSTGTAIVLRSANAATAAAGTSGVKGGLTPSSTHTTSPSSRAAAPATTATVRHSCRDTALPSTAEARGSAVQGGKAAAPRPALRTSSAAAQPVPKGALHQQSSRATAAPAAHQKSPPIKSISIGSNKAANRSLRATPVSAPAVGMTTRRQAAAAATTAAAQHEAKPRSGFGAASTTTRPRQARSLKPEAPSRRQPQRAAKLQWR